MLNLALTMHSSRSANLGVGALSEAEVAILRKIAKRIGVGLGIEILDWKGPVDSYVVGPDITIRDMDGKTLVSPFGYFRYVKNADIVIDIGAGDSFADIYGSKRLTRMFLMKYLCHFAGTPLVLGPQTYGPFTRSVSTALSRGTLARSSLVASRDDLSTEVIRRIAPSVEVVEASDVALLLPYEKHVKTENIERVRVGLNISGLLMHGGYSGKNDFSLAANYPNMIAKLVRELLSRDVELHLVAHVIPTDRGGVEDDLQPSYELQREFPDIIVAPPFRTPSEAKTYISGLDFFAGARMHACIAAFSSGVPVVPMAYSRKFSGLFGSLGYDWTADCTKDTEDSVISQVIFGLENRGLLKRQMLPAFEKGIARLEAYEKGLEDLFRAVLKGKGIQV